MNMIIKFLVKQIMSGNATYENVIKSRPDLKEDIDKYIEENNLFQTNSATEKKG